MRVHNAQGVEDPIDFRWRLERALNLGRGGKSGKGGLETDPAASRAADAYADWCWVHDTLGEVVRKRAKIVPDIEGDADLHRGTHHVISVETPGGPLRHRLAVGPDIQLPLEDSGSEMLDGADRPVWWRAWQLSYVRNLDDMNWSNNVGTAVYEIEVSLTPFTEGRP